MIDGPDNRRSGNSTSVLQSEKSTKLNKAAFCVSEGWVSADAVYSANAWPLNCFSTFNLMNPEPDFTAISVINNSCFWKVQLISERMLSPSIVKGRA